MSLALIISKLEGFVTDPGSVAPDPDSDSSAESSSEESEDVDLEDLTELLLWVDKIDSGQITKDEYLSNKNANTRDFYI